ncbi:MAG: hypothetical protein K0S74_1044 [Chlamydiales bacterium]|nr:hypothetical protein [Chlamydiales bacterium]
MELNGTKQNKTENQTGNWIAAKATLTKLSPVVLKHFSDQTWKALEEASSEAHFYSDLQKGVPQNPQQLPIFRGVTLPLFLKSPYDDFTTHYTLQIPQSIKPQSSLIIILEDSKNPSDPISDDSTWVIRCHSRPGLDFHFLAEGEFWYFLEQIYTLYPCLKDSTKFLIGLGASADAALRITNNFRNHFNGLAFSGGQIGPHLNNLDHLPVIFFDSPFADKTGPLSGKYLIQRLQARGNQNCKAIPGELKEALVALFNQKRTHNESQFIIPPFSFEDYQYSCITPWLKLISKQTENQPCTIAAKLEGQTLHIHSSNIESVEISPPSFPAEIGKSIKTIHFNNQLYAIDHSRAYQIIGEDVEVATWKHKANTPSGILNFYRNEPLFVIYQDKAVDAEYRYIMQNWLQKLCSFQLLGLPHHYQVNLPKLALSKYDPHKLPPHRAIFLGNSKDILQHLEHKKGYLPLPDTADSDEIAYGLIYPPEVESPLKLALALIAPDSAGLEALQSYYSSATALYEIADRVVWEKRGENYAFSQKINFDTYWGLSHLPLNLLEMPPFTSFTWENYLKEILIQENPQCAIAVSSLVDKQTPSPTEINFENIKRFIPEKNFIKVELNSHNMSTIGNQLINSQEHLVPLGLDNLVAKNKKNDRGEFVGDRLQRNQFIEVIFESSVLNHLSKDELSKLNYTVLPYSLRELLIRKIVQSPESFGKDFLRFANQTTYSQKVNYYG